MSKLIPNRNWFFMPSIYIFSWWPGKEHDVSLASGKNIFEEAKHLWIFCETHMVVLEKNGIWKLNENPVKKEFLFEKIKNEHSLVFPIIHGTFWEDGELASLLENENIFFIGSWSETLKLTIDKQATGNFLNTKGIRVPRSFSVTDISQIAALPMVFPCIVKPKNEWSSVSLYKPKSKEELQSILEKELAFRKEVLVQECIAWREFTCGVIEVDWKNRVLPPSEIILTKGDTFDYAAKYTIGWCREITPADIDNESKNTIQSLAKSVHEYCWCKDISRTDIILSETGEFVVLEINTIPGMTETSFIPAQLKAENLSIQDFMISMKKKYINCG